MTGYLLCATVIFLLAFAFKLHFYTELSITLPISINAIAVLLYVFGIGQTLYAGVYIVIGSSVLYLISQSNKIKLSRNDIIQTGIYIVFVAIFFIIHSGRVAYFSDDLNHWLLVTKKISFANRFAIFEPIQVEFAHYPEISSMPSYMACLLNGGFDEGIVFAVQSLWCCLLLFPLFYKKRTLVQYLLLFLFVLVFPIIWGGAGNAYTSLQVDRLIGILLGYCLLSIYSKFGKGDIKFISLLTGTVTLTGLKESGLYFSILLIMLYIQKEKDQGLKRTAIQFCEMSGGNLFAFISWKILVSISGAQVSKNYWREFSLKAIRCIIDETKDPRHQILVDSLYRLMRIDNYSIGANKSYLLWVVFLIVILIFLLYGQEKWIHKLIKICCAGIVVLVAWYAGIMYVICFRFPDDQGLIGFDRYMDTIFIAATALAFGLLFRNINRLHSGILSGTICVLLLFSASTAFNNGHAVYDTYANCRVFRKWAEDKIEMEIVNTMDPCRDKIYVVSQKDGEYVSSSYFQASVIVAPVPINYEFASCKEGGSGLSFFILDRDTENPYCTKMSPDEWRVILEDYTYLLLMNFGDDFVESYGDMFMDSTITYGLYIIENGMFKKV